MWTIFKIINLYTILVSAYIWVTSLIPIGPLMFVLNLGMITCLGFLPIQFKFDKRTGLIILALLALVVWTLCNETAMMGMVMVCMYLPVLYLIPLPREYQADLLKFVTKWMAIILIPALLIYWLTLFTTPPSFGEFVYPSYVPFKNYIFYLKTTYDTGIFVRFNAFFFEPGHLSMVCVFLLMANKFDFKSNRWLWVILISILFSFSLAGYILTLTGFALMKVNSVAKALVLVVIVAGGVFAIQNFYGGENAVNQLILNRLKYDQEKGIEGNNRFFHNTDYEYDKALKNGNYWTGVSGKANMELIGGAGFKIYILKHGLIGVFLVFIFYLSLIPPNPNWHYTLSFLFLVALCFVQNAYPGWYAWLFPFVIGLDLNSKQGSSGQNSQDTLSPSIDN